MTINDLITQLSEASAKLAALTPNDPTRFDLEIAISQIRKEIIAGSFNIDEDLAAIHLPDLTKLKQYVSELRAATTAEQVSPGIGGKIMGIVRLVVPALGI